MYENVKATSCVQKQETLTETLQQNEKLLFSIQERLDALEYRVNGPVPMPCDVNSSECGRTETGVIDQARYNRELSENILSGITRIVEKL